MNVIKDICYHQKNYVWELWHHGYRKRPMIEYIRKQRDDGSLVGLEVGTHKGNNALYMMRMLDLKRLFCVDPYVGYDERSVDDVRSAERSAHQRLNCFPRCLFIKADSKDAVDVVKRFDVDLDFVYIDGNHSYESVQSDITVWYPLVKSGGLLGGHNFEMGYLGVVFAVVDFVRAYDLVLYGDDTDWWIEKI